MKIDLKKGAGYVGNTLGKAAEIGKKAADSAKSGAQSIADKAQVENRKAQMKKYNPVFPDQYTNPNFNLSNLIMIVDDVVRKDIDICEGAIGWKTFKKGVEVFYLYDEAIEFSGLHFIPYAVCDTIYYVDVHNRNRFIQLDRYLETMENSKTAELEHIAYSLGAKKYSIKRYNTSSEKHTSRQSASLKGKEDDITVGASEEKNLTVENEVQNKLVTHSGFEGEKKPTQPELLWFAYDDHIKNLINIRCTEEDKIEMKTHYFEFIRKDIATMSESTAIKLDIAYNSLGLGNNLKLHSKTVKEHCQNMLFQLEF